MRTLHQIKEALEDRNLTRVAEETGISAAYLSQLRMGKKSNPGYEVLEKLNNYIDKSCGISCK